MEVNDIFKILGFIDQVIAETNQGYAQSGISVTITKFCIEEATINDNPSAVTTLNNFASMKVHRNKVENIDKYQDL